MPDNLPFLPLAELSGLLADDKASSREIVEACLARIDLLDSRLHAFVDVYRDDAPPTSTNSGCSAARSRGSRVGCAIAAPC